MKNLFTVIMMLICATSIAVGQEQAVKTGKLIINYENLKSDEGNAMLKLYDESSPKFPDTKSAIAIRTVKVEHKQATIIFDGLPYGTYAFSTFHDENGNGKMDTNRIYFPTEGYAFSNNLKIMFGPPSFEKASFELSAAVKNIKIKLNY